MLAERPVPRRGRKKTQDETFGRRLARLRRSRGLTQPELARKLGISGRMMAYYEAQTDRPPAHLLGRIGEVLGVTTDALLGVRSVRIADPPVDLRLWRRLRIVEGLSPADRKAVLDFIEGIVARRKLQEQQHG